MSRENDTVFAGSLRACQLHDVPHEVLTPSQVRERYPGYRLPDDTYALFPPDGGFLVPEACIVAYAQGAMAAQTSPTPETP